MFGSVRERVICGLGAEMDLVDGSTTVGNPLAGA